MTLAISAPALISLLKIDSQLKNLGETPDYFTALQSDIKLLKLHMKGAVMGSMESKQEKNEEWVGELYTKLLSRTSDDVLFG